MRWESTKASECRWAEFAEQNWGDWDFIWEEAEVDYQGHAKILAHKDGRFVYAEWSYGSCSGCDSWEGMNTSEAKKDFDTQAEYYEDVHHLEKWVKMTGHSKPGLLEAVKDFMFHAAMEKEWNKK